MGEFNRLTSAPDPPNSRQFPPPSAVSAASGPPAPPAVRSCDRRPGVARAARSLGVAPWLLVLGLGGLGLGCPPAGGGDGSATAADSASSSTSTSTDGGGITLTEPWASATAATNPTEPTTAGGGVSSEPMDSEGSSDSEDSSDSSDSEDSEDSENSGDTADNPASCKKVDILLAIDNGQDNIKARPALVEMIPYLADRIQTDLAGWDLHLMVIQGDDLWGNVKCDDRCELQGDCEGHLPDYPCDYEPVPCDRTLGAGVRAPTGFGGANKECPIAGGRRYLLADQPDLHGTLDCVRRIPVGHTGKRRQMESIFQALGPELNAPGACNAGFYREDAYLVLMMVTTQYDWHTPGGPDEWAQRLLAFKGGKFDRIFLIGLYDGGKCDKTWESFYFYDFAEQIYHAITGHYCEEDFIPYIDAALDFLHGACPG